jgi:N-dimethylarginine dimethylaminohydrolase
MVDQYGPDAMDYRAPVSMARFQEEFDQLVSVFSSEGGEVVLVNDVLKHDADVQRYIARRPNMVYTRDLAAVTRGGAIISQMARKTRRGDTFVIKRALERLGVPILTEIQLPGTVEGGDYIFLDERTLAIGWGNRTNEAGIDQVRQALLGKYIDELVVVAMKYSATHLDGPLMMVDHRLAVGNGADLNMYPSILYRSGKEPRYIFLADYFEEKGIEFMEGKANFGIRPGVLLNIKSIHDATVKLRERGYTVHEVDGEMMWRGGSAPHCLTCPLVRDPTG